MKELARYKNIIVCLLIVFVSMVLLRSVHSNYSRKLQGLAEEEKQIKETKDAIVKWAGLNNKYKQLRSNFLEKDTSLFKKLIEEKARIFNIDLPFLQLSRVDKDSYWEVKVKINTTSSYEAFIEFVDSLADKNLEVVSVSLGGADTNVTVNVEIKGVVLK